MNLCFPDKVLEQHLVALGKTGAGKSSALRHIVEHLLTKNKRVCVLDPKGDWWGLKMSADGKSAGFPVVALGDFKEPKAADLPINPQAGKQIAELVVSGNRPCVIGLRGWMPAQQARFWIDFASTVFNSNTAGGLHLVIDEIQNLAPKERAGFGDENMALHWTKRLLSEGRGLGLSIFCGSQRPQSVHNGVLTQCETLLAMRLIHPNDCAAVEAWLSATRDKEKRATIMSSLPDLERGEAWVWSPEIGFGPKRLKFPMFETFDSFAPPQTQKKISDRGWSTTDLDAVKAKLASVLEEAKANDPRHLKTRISELNATIAKLESTAKLRAQVAPNEVIKEVPVMTADERKALEALNHQVAGTQDTLLVASKLLYSIFERVETTKGTKVRFAPIASTPPNKPGHFSKLAAEKKLIPADAGEPATIDIGTGGKRRILIALAQYPGGMAARRLSLLTGISASGGTWRTYLGELRSAGYVDGGSSSMKITGIGRAVLGDFEPLPTGEALREYWRTRLGDSGKRKIFDVVVAAYPEALTYEQVSHETNIVQSGGTWRTYIGELRGLELITGRGDLRAADELFT